MEAQDYALAWLFYMIAALVLTIISWRVLKKYLWRELAYLLQGMLVAVLYTPWYVLPDQEELAPAFIIFLMDAITIDPTAGIRALIPLVMAVSLAIIISFILGIVYRVSGRNRAGKS